MKIFISPLWFLPSAFFILLPILALGSNHSGNWSGSGHCYLNPAHALNNGCDYVIHIDHQEDRLSILNCITWRQQWGEGIECPQSRFKIRNQNELWIIEPQRSFKAGTISKNKITIEYEFWGGFNHEYYHFDQTKLSYKNTYESSGMQWIYYAELAPAEENSFEVKN